MSGTTTPDAPPAWWAFTRENLGLLHLVDGQAVLDHGVVGNQTLCGVGAWHTHPKTPFQPDTVWAKARLNDICATIAQEQGLLTADEVKAFDQP